MPYSHLMRAATVANAIRMDRRRTVEIDGPLSGQDLEQIAWDLGIEPRLIYICCGNVEKLRVSIPLDIPIRDQSRF